MVAFGACAGGPGAVRKQVETSMIVTGTIDIGPDGSVPAYSLDKPEALPDSVVELAKKALPLWRFKPVLIDGKPVHGRAKMSLRYVAKKQDNGNYRVRISSAWFGESSSQPGEHVSSQSLSPPNYPSSALRSGITGTTYIVLRVGRKGTVEDAVVERVNLRVIGSDRLMEWGRKQLGQASLAAARKWTFSIPTTGPKADAPYWDVRVPVTYLYAGQEPVAYGKWDAYVPGPQHEAPWIQDDRNHGSDALVAGGVYPVGGGPELLTRLEADAG